MTDLERLIDICIRSHGGFRHGNWLGFCPICTIVMANREQAGREPAPETPPLTATCPYCDEIVRLRAERQRLIVAVHEDVYPTRVCEGSNRIAEVVSGRVYISKGQR